VVEFLFPYDPRATCAQDADRKTLSMKHTRILMVGALALAVALPTEAAAQSIETFVSGHGSDDNPCWYVQPCRSFAHAITATTAGGTIYVLDSAQYGGQVTITKSINIVNDGAGAAIIAVPSGGTGITIQAAPDGVVNLRGLTIAGGDGSIGINFVNGPSLTVENSVIQTGNVGISYTSNMNSSLTVSNTRISGNKCCYGISVTPRYYAGVQIIVDRVQLNNNNTAVALNGSGSVGSITATISNSVIAGGSSGISVRTASGKAPTTLTLVHSVVANSNLNDGAGLMVDGPGATLIAARSTVSGNTHGWSVTNGGILASYDDNYFDGNGSNTGSLTPIARQ
jgi:hypothetical protein